jgi:hypothetical protein
LARSADLCQRSLYLSEQISRAVALACRLSRGSDLKKVANTAGVVLSPLSKLNTVQDDMSSYEQRSHMDAQDNCVFG